MNPQIKNIIAIDIAKDSLHVLAEGKHFCMANTQKGFQELLPTIAELSDPCVVCEATGGYERALMAFCHQHKIEVCRVNPAQVRAFAKSDGIRAKTDPIDADVLLRFAQSKRLRATPAPEAEREELAALLDRRVQLSGALAREKNRLQKSPETILNSINRMIKMIEKEIAKIDEMIEKTLQRNQELAEQARLMETVKGVGKITSRTILAYLNELDRLNRNQAVALAGIAPYNRDSGKTSGKRSIQAGRAKVRRCLYMAAQTAANHNPVIKPYVEGLIARGKPYKCAIVAAMRKLLIHIQVILKNNKKCLA